MKTGTIEISDFIQYLKDEGLVVVPKSIADEMLVDGIPLERYRARMMRKNLLSSREISAARLWGSIGKAAVKKIIKDMVPKSDQVTVGNMGTIKIPLGTVKSIALSRGCTWG